VEESDPTRARAEIERMCEQLLANTIIENYAYELEAA
jgi:phosphoribosylformylglycinamidine synthase